MEINEPIGKESNLVPEEEIKNISEILSEIQSSQNSNEVYPQKIYDLHYYINDVKEKEYQQTQQISDLFTNNYIFLFRTLLLQEKGIRIIILKILRNNIQIYPQFTEKLLDALYPLVICKIFEEFKKNTFRNDMNV